MPYNGGPYGIEVPENQGISTENMAYRPKLWHTDPNYGIQTQTMAYEPSLLFGGGQTCNN